MQTIVRMRPEDIYDPALEVAAVRPGVGANSGAILFPIRAFRPAF